MSRHRHYRNIDIQGALEEDDHIAVSPSLRAYLDGGDGGEEDAPMYDPDEAGNEYDEGYYDQEGYWHYWDEDLGSASDHGDHDGAMFAMDDEVAPQPNPTPKPALSPADACATVLRRVNKNHHFRRMEVMQFLESVDMDVEKAVEGLLASVKKDDTPPPAQASATNANDTTAHNLVSHIPPSPSSVSATASASLFGTASFTPLAAPAVSFPSLNATPANPTAPAVSFPSLNATPGNPTAPAVSFPSLNATPANPTAPAVSFPSLNATPANPTAPAVSFPSLNATPATPATSAVSFPSLSLAGNTNAGGVAFPSFPTPATTPTVDTSFLGITNPADTASPPPGATATPTPTATSGWDSELFFLIQPSADTSDPPTRALPPVSAPRGSSLMDTLVFGGGSRLSPCAAPCTSFGGIVTRMSRTRNPNPVPVLRAVYNQRDFLPGQPTHASLAPRPVFQFNAPSPDDMVLLARRKAIDQRNATATTKTTKSTKTATATTSHASDDLAAMGMGTTTTTTTTTTSAEDGFMDADMTEADYLEIRVPDKNSGRRSAQASPRSPRKPFVRRRSKANKRLMKAFEEERASGSRRDAVNLVVAGHVDAGKSTMMGHLLYLLDEVSQREIHRFERDSAQQGKGSFSFAWVLDAHDEERARGVTMDVAVTHFTTPSKDVTLLDAPGHRDFVPNMISGAAQADSAILVVSAREGEFEAGFDDGGQTKEHAQLLRSLGVSQMIVAINKLDTVDWSEERYTAIQARVTTFLNRLGIRTPLFVPVAGLKGANLVNAAPLAELAPWYTAGMSLVDAIDALEPAPRNVDAPLRLPVSDVYKSISMSGATVAGKVEMGRILLDDQVMVMPGYEVYNVKALESRQDGVQWAQAGDNVDVCLRDAEMASLMSARFLCDPEHPIPMTSCFRAQVILFELPVPITKGQQVVLHYHNVNEDAFVSKLLRIISTADGKPVRAAEGKKKKRRPRRLASNETAEIEIRTRRPVCLETFKDCKEMGRVTLRQGGRTLACGVVTRLCDFTPSVFVQ